MPAYDQTSRVLSSYSGGLDVNGERVSRPALQASSGLKTSRSAWNGRNTRDIPTRHRHRRGSAHMGNLRKAVGIPFAQVGSGKARDGIDDYGSSEGRLESPREGMPQRQASIVVPQGAKGRGGIATTRTRWATPAAGDERDAPIVGHRVCCNVHVRQRDREQLNQGGATKMAGQIHLSSAQRGAFTLKSFANGSMPVARQTG
jgi:hypothetical protein